MCGLAGFYGDFAPHLLGQMATALAHRGPDGEGVWHSAQQGFGLAHRRLSIIDLSSAASQPMAGVAGRYQVVFNGEIYNFKALLQRPELKPYNFNRHSDTALLAPLYDVHGPAMLQRLEGMFAFALADTQTGELFLARDHAGIKPLYYAITPQGLLFASELKALAAVAQVAGIDLTPDPTALQEYVSFLWTPSVRTPLLGIRKLRPGHYLQAQRGQGGAVEVTITRWWQPPAAQPALRQWDATPAQLATLWDEIVAEQCTADVPPGAFLSGGVDSSAVVASMVATGHAPVQTYCIGFKGQGYERGMAAEGFADDAHYANLMAKHAGVPLTVLQVEVDETLSKFPALAWQLDEPTADPAPLLVTAIAQQARTDGLKLLMSGTGGDDVLTGYRRHQSARLRELLGPLGGAAGGLCGALAGLAPGAALRRRLGRLSGLLGGSDEEFLLHAFLTNSQPDAAQLVHHGGQDAWGDELRAAIGASRGLPLVERLLQAEAAGFLPDHNLNYGDKAGMAAGVEIRVPFTDRRLLQFMAQIPSRQKMQGLQPKAFFKQAMRGRVPDEILYRSKTGFGAPLRTWLQHGGRAVLEDVIMNCDAQLFNRTQVQRLWQRTLGGEIDGSYTILAVAMIEWWFAALKQSSGMPAKLR
jgi:asparagine synthase (glutamine-hydrolysing)